MPTVTVHLFAGLKEAVGERIQVALPEEATAADLKCAVAERFPESAELVERSAVAVDRRLVRSSEAVTPGEEIALLPPVSGG
ncbi:MAG: MoaD/ThiS family protein [bacterium]